MKIRIVKPPSERNCRPYCPFIIDYPMDTPQPAKPDPPKLGPPR